MSTRTCGRDYVSKHPERIGHFSKLKIHINVNNKNKTNPMKRSREEFIFIPLNFCQWPIPIGFEYPGENFLEPCLMNESVSLPS